MRIENLGEIVESGRRIVSSELREAVAHTRAELERNGVRPGSAVALVQGNEAIFFTNLFAVWELGACAVPLPPTATQAELSWCLSHSGASVALYGDRIHNLSEDGRAPPEGTCLLLYTSGSTGTSKGVVLSFEALRAKLKVLLRMLEPATLQRTLCFVPVSFGHGLLGNSLPALLSGHTLYLEPGMGTGLANQLGPLVDRYGITFFSSVPATWQATLNFSPSPTAASLRKVFCASAPISPAIAARVRAWIGGQASFHDVYGLTETASWVAELGGALFGCELRVNPISSEIEVSAPYLMTGYHLEPEASDNAFSGNWLRTGDLGELREGRLFISGRLKEQINRGGMKVSPLEVERRLLEYPGVAEACVIGVPDSVTGEAVQAVLVAHKGATLETQGLRDFCRMALSEYKIPEVFLLLPQLPRTIRGKIDKTAVRRLFEAMP